MPRKIFNMDGVPFKSKTEATKTAKSLEEFRGYDHIIEEEGDGYIVIAMDDVISTTPDNDQASNQVSNQPTETKLSDEDNQSIDLSNNSLNPLNPLDSPTNQKSTEELLTRYENQENNKQLISLSLKPSLFSQSTEMFKFALCISAASLVSSYAKTKDSFIPEIILNSSAPGYLTLALIVLGLFYLIQPIWYRVSRTYFINETEIRSKTGIFTRDGNSINPKDVKGIHIKQSFFDKIFNVGTITFASAGTDQAEVIFNGIKKPVELREQSQALITELNKR